MSSPVDRQENEEERSEGSNQEFVGDEEYYDTLVDDDEEVVNDEETGNSTDYFDENESFLKEEDETDSEEIEGLCKHYIRRCYLVCDKCDGRHFPCRLCHDDQIFTHQFDRFNVTHVVCSTCNLKQKVSEKCEKCEVDFGKYICLICNMFDDRDKGQFHCDKCGLCRVGGKDNFFHCDKCGLCRAVESRDDHNCVERVSHDNCPICLTYLHTSVTTTHINKCGHMLHRQCYKQLLRQGQYRCPTCLISMIDMSAEWRRVDEDIASTPMPEEYRNVKRYVHCYDCVKKSHTDFHVIGLRCVNCGSYNTTEETPPPQDDDGPVENQTPS